MKRIGTLLLVGLLAMPFSACALNTTAPVLTPSAATAITNGLTALKDILVARNVDAAVVQIITDAQQGISQDAGGTTWGGLLRTMLTDLYSQLPLSVQNQPVVWASLAALEVTLATIGA